MLLTIALIVFFSSVLLFFSDEFAKVLKKIAAIPGVLIFVPLILASMLIIEYEPWVLWFLLSIKLLIHYVIGSMGNLLPESPYKNQIVAILVLSLFILLPVCFFDWRWKKRSNMPSRHNWLVFLILWSFFSILYLVSFYY